MSHPHPASSAGAAGPTRRGRGAFRLLALLSLFVMLGGGIILTPSIARADSTTTTTSDLNLRSGPGTGYGVILVMPSGAQVTVTGDPQNGFYPVNYQGTDGFASGDFLAIGGGGGSSDSSGGGTPSATGTAYVIDGSLNLRSGPGTDSSIITVMPDGAQVTLTGTLNNGFLSVSYQGTDGWAYAIYISTSGPSDSGNSGNSGSGSDTSGGDVTSGPTGTAWVIDGALNLRSDPSTSAAVLTVMPDGAQVSLTGQASNGFRSVTFQGTDGWAWGDYLSTTQPSSNNGSGATSGGGTGADTSNAGTPSSNDIVAIIDAAADKYGQPRADMLRVAECESNLDPNAVNPSSGASGLFQFMPSTWASTPYANQSIFDATANANAAGWMWSVGRRNEWTCQ